MLITSYVYHTVRFVFLCLGVWLPFFVPTAPTPYFPSSSSTQDFFVVCFFLAWLVVALIPHYASHNEVLLDAWLSIWGVVIQPLLGVLMAGTIVAGTLSYVQSKEEITTM